MIPIIMVLGLTAFVVVGFVIYTLKNLLLVSSPNEVLVLSGGSHQVGSREVGYRSVRGGRAVRIPLLERVDRMDLNNIPVDISVKGAYSKGGIPLNVQGVAHVKLPGEEPRLSNAVERFLGKSRDEIAAIARETLEGNVRGVLAQLTPEQVNQDKTAFADKLLEEAEHDMQRMGLVLDTLKIQNVADDANYLNSIGRMRGASVRMDASIVEARTQAESAEQKAENWAKSEVAKIDADLAIARQETQKRIKDAMSRREAMIQEAKGQVLAQIAQVKAEINRQKARALQVERQLLADVIQPHDAERRNLEEQARGDAAKIIELGKAEAEALHRIVDEIRKAGPGALEILALQQMMPLLPHIAGARTPTKIGTLSVLPSGDDGSLARKAIAMTEQIRAATGLDLTDVARRLGTSAPAPALAAPSAPPPPPQVPSRSTPPPGRTPRA
ncbi:flotillin family protein [Polyangium jinanense]|uniref:flotillin family protein n=1 Tax=Polyangium jinanense TaxID=2829994 RepID=UPI00233F9481|nr:flotillin family protein [Polyangium jinanense]MDC3960828.1 flotillin family protein [Polyangium jinanense]MDC3961007.1 flotillin family protein [Polyangium jinanense]